MKKFLAMFVAFVGVVAATTASAPCVWVYIDEPELED